MYTSLFITFCSADDQLGRTGTLKVIEFIYTRGIID